MMNRQGNNIADLTSTQVSPNLNFDLKLIELDDLESIRAALSIGILLGILFGIAGVSMYLCFGDLL